MTFFVYEGPCMLVHPNLPLFTAPKIACHVPIMEPIGPVASKPPVKVVIANVTPIFASSKLCAHLTNAIPATKVIDIPDKRTYVKVVARQITNTRFPSSLQR